jgi:hypothetical protein
MRAVDLVGPKGYEHGWKFVGVPGVTPHSDLLRMRKEARTALPQGHPERRKAENAVRKSRKVATGGTEEDWSARTEVLPTDEPQREALRKAADAATLRNQQIAADQRSVRYHVTRDVEPAQRDTSLPQHLRTPTAAEEGAAILRKAQRESVLGPKKPRKAKGGVHPSEVTVSEARMMKGSTYPNASARRHGQQPQYYQELRSGLKHGDKTYGGVGTRVHPGYAGRGESYTAELSTGNKNVYLGGVQPGASHEEAHAQMVEKARHLFTAEINARRARAALAAKGYSPVKSHSTSVRGWRNYDPGAEINAGDSGVGISYYGGSSLVGRSKDSDYRSQQLEKYAEVLRERGFVVEVKRGEDGLIESLFLPNDKQGGGTTVSLTAETATASTVHHPLGKPGGPGLFHMKGAQLPAYIQNVAHALIRGGKPKERAIPMAIGIVKNWAHGHDGHGNNVSPEVQAAAAKAIAEWQSLKARARSTSNTGHDAVELVGPKGYVHGWIKASEAGHVHGMRVKAITRSGRKIRGKYDKKTRAVRGHPVSHVHGPLRKSQVSTRHSKMGATGKAMNLVPAGLANEPSEVIELFNPYHAPAGAPTGGQFAAKSGSSSEGQKTTKQERAKQPGRPSGPQQGKSSAGRKKRLIARAGAMRGRANTLEAQMHGLQGQLHSLNAGRSTSHGGSKATGTTTKGKTAKVRKAKKTAKTAKKATTTAAKAGAAAKNAGPSAPYLRVRIATLRIQIRTLRRDAADLVKEARKL